MRDDVDCFDIQTRVMRLIIHDRIKFPDALEHCICLHGEQMPTEVAAELREVEYESTYADLKAWLRDLLRLDPPPQDTVALYYGMADFAPNEGSPVEYIQFYIFYIDGAPCFDPDDEGEWACECSWTYGSDLRYPVCSTYVDIAKACNKQGNLVTFTISQAFTACLAIELAPVLAEHHAFQRLGRYPVAVGHDSGDIYIVGYLTPDDLAKP